MDDRSKGVSDADRMVGRAAEDVLGYSETPRVVRPVEDEYLAGPVAREGKDEAPAKRTREIRQEIEQTREDMSETIDAIQEKLRPRNIVAQATSSVRSAASEKVRDMREMASTAGEAAGDTARQNPIPMAMMGLGAAWMMMNRSSSERAMSQRYVNTRGEVTGGDNGWIERIKDNPVPAALAGIGLAWLAFGDSGHRSRSTASYDRYRSAADYNPSLHAAGHTVGGYSATSYSEDESGTGVGEMASNIASRAGDLAQDARLTARRTTRRAQNQLERLLQDNPLMVGAAAAVIGAAVGAALPETERENEWMGEARDSVVSQAQEMARDAKSKVQEAAGGVADTAGRLVEEIASSKKP